MDNEKTKADKRLLKAALDGGIFYDMIGEKMDVDKIKDRQEWTVIAEEGIYRALSLPLYCAWIALFVWPGAHYIANVVNIDTPGYLGSVGMVAIIAVLVRVIKGCRYLEK